MTQLINDKLKKCCVHCQTLLDKPCAWLSLGNEYCPTIMEVQQEIERLEVESENKLHEKYPFIVENGIICRKNKEIERLNKENNILKKNAEHNDKVVDNVNWENMFFKKIIDKVIEYIDKELCNINIQENIVAKNELLKIQGILRGVVKNV